MRLRGIDFGDIDPLSADSELIFVAPPRRNSLEVAGLIGTCQWREFIVVIAVRIFNAESALDAACGVVSEIDVVIEVPFLVAIPEFKDVAKQPRVVGIR